jgi:hypothetical protein
MLLPPHQRVYVVEHLLDLHVHLKVTEVTSKSMDAVLIPKKEEG